MSDKHTIYKPVKEMEKECLNEKLDTIEPFIGNTPLCKLDWEGKLYAKLEYYNLMGSIKDRPAFYILKEAINKGLVQPGTTIIESTSGNFGIGLAGICRKLGLRFIPVIDPNITVEKETILRLLSYKVVKVDKPDESGGYLSNRIQKVKELLSEIPGSFNPNQYQNENNFLAYYHTLGKEIGESFEKLDYVFVSVSSGGTITGLSRRLKEKFPHVKVVAVDIEGSLIFDNRPRARRLSGLGASIRTPIVDRAIIDDVMILSEDTIISGCRQLVNEQSILGGASAGAVYQAFKMYCDKWQLNDPENIFLLVIPDNGSAYINSIYNDEWIKRNIQNNEYKIFKQK